MITSHELILFTSVVVACLSLYLISKMNANEGYAVYPNSPSDPSLPFYNPLDPQSVYAQFGDQFGLTYNPETIDQGAFRSLDIMDQRAMINNYNFFNHEWKLNDGFNNTGNTEWALNLSQKPYYAWDLL